MKRITRPWTGKSDNLPNPQKKEQHKERVCKKARLYELEEKDWKEQLKEYASKQI